MNICISKLKDKQKHINFFLKSEAFMPSYIEYIIGISVNYEDSKNKQIMKNETSDNNM